LYSLFFWPPQAVLQRSQALTITITEIYDYISRKVKQATRGKQTPMLKAPEAAGQIILTGGPGRLEP
jgi:hypothetical protein